MRCSYLRLFVAIALAGLAVSPLLNAQGPGSGEMVRGSKFAEEGDYDKAIESYTKGLKAAPNWEYLHFLRAHAWDKKGEYDKAIADYDEALRQSPEDAAAYVGRGITWDKKGKHDKAVADYSRALQVKQEDVYFYYNIRTSKVDQATTDGKEILRLRHADAYYWRGRSWTEKGEYGKAVADFNDALRIRPKDTDALCALARLQATCPDAKYRDGKAAIDNANRAHQLSGGTNWRCIDTLAAAYAESGDFDKARQWQEKAMQLSVNDKSARDKDKEALHSRLELYKAKKPYREP